MLFGMLRCMAGEVGHVVYGARLLMYLGDGVEHPSYWAGTLFPDIRHMGVVSRRRTHPKDVTLSSLSGQNDFHTGSRVHAWLDATREKFLRDAHIKESLPWHPFVPHALKLIEDEYLYDQYDDWNLIHRVLGNVYDEELAMVKDRTRVLQWHTILQNYLRNKPDDASRHELSLAIGLSENSAQEVNSVVTMLNKEKGTRMLIDTFVEHLERILM